jgi:hypothetical protein
VLYSRLAPHLLASLNEFTPHDLAQVLWSYATAGAANKASHRGVIAQPVIVAEVVDACTIVVHTRKEGTAQRSRQRHAVSAVACDFCAVTTV